MPTLILMTMSSVSLWKQDRSPNSHCDENELAMNVATQHVQAESDGT